MIKVCAKYSESRLSTHQKKVQMFWKYKKIQKKIQSILVLILQLQHLCNIPDICASMQYIDKYTYINKKYFIYIT